MTQSAIAVIVNAGSGGGNDQALVDRLAGHFEAAGLHAEIELARGGDEIATAVGNAIARRPRLIVAGGGDGTVSSVAATLVDTGIVFGVLPLGTLNHFARDLGIPLDLGEAVAVLARGQAARVDVGEVNGRIFVNNSGLGLYPDIVHDRERQQKRLGRGKWPAFAWAMWSALRRFPFMTLQMNVDGQTSRIRTPFLFIGNNRYEMSGLRLGRRTSLQSGTLSIHLAQRAGRLRLLQLALNALMGRLGSTADFIVLDGQRLEISSRHATLQVATDGEVTRLPTPLACRIHPRALQVWLPAGEH